MKQFEAEMSLIIVFETELPDHFILLKFFFLGGGKRTWNNLFLLYFEL